MKTITLLLIISLVTGCAGVPATNNSPDAAVLVHWVRLPRAEVAHACAVLSYDGKLVGMPSKGSEMLSGSRMMKTDDADVGCYRMRGNVCEIITPEFTLRNGTRSETNKADSANMNTAGHELRHCFDGDFHTEDK